MLVIGDETFSVLPRQRGASRHAPQAIALHQPLCNAAEAPVHLCLSVVPAVRACVDAKCGPASFPCLSSFRRILLCALSKGMP